MHLDNVDNIDEDVCTIDTDMENEHIANADMGNALYSSTTLLWIFVYKMIQMTMCVWL